MNDTLKQPMNDGVLTVTRWILFFLIGIMVFAGVMVAIGAIAIPFMSGDILQQMTENFVDPDTSGAIWILVLLLAGVASVLALSAYILLKLNLIVKSAGEGDPFVRENAARLRVMAYATLAMQGVFILITGLANWLIMKMGEIKAGSELDIQTDFDISLTGILMFFLLIILARIFDRGADMREELEGTV